MISNSDCRTRVRSATLTTAALLCLLPHVPLSLAAQPQELRPDTLASPAGGFKVVFRPVAHRTFTNDESLAALDNVDHIEYALVFIRVADGGTVAEFTYADVYGFEPSGKPTEPRVIASWFDWSPEEDFVILPSEGWASAPGTPERPVLALAGTMGWSEGTLAMDTLIWANPLVVLGGRHRDCDHGVEVFDGGTGRLRSLHRPPESPIGYEIHSVEGRTVLVRQVLDNCRRDDPGDTWAGECHAVDLNTFEASPAPCPESSTSSTGSAASGQQSFPGWVPLFDQELVDWLSNEYRVSELCAEETADSARCYERMTEPLVKVLHVRRNRSIAAPPVGEIILVAVPGKGLTAHARFASRGEAPVWTPDLYDPDWGYGPYLHQTFLAREGNWFLIPTDPFDSPVWVLFGAGSTPREIREVRRGDILDFEDKGWFVVEATASSLTLREEQDTDMWCEPGDPPPVMPAATRSLTRSELSDERGHLLIRPKYTRGC